MAWETGRVGGELLSTDRIRLEQRILARRSDEVVVPGVCDHRVPIDHGLEEGLKELPQQHVAACGRLDGVCGLAPLIDAARLLAQPPPPHAFIPLLAPQAA